jgi:hypothetical protein
MNNSFFGKIFGFTLLFLILAEFNSLASFIFLPVKYPAFMIIILAAFFLALFRAEYGLYFIIAELSVGGMGHLFDIGGLSIRMGLFGAVLSAWVIGGIWNPELGIKNLKSTAIKSIDIIKKNFFIPNSLFLIHYSLLLIFIFFGIIQGLISNQTGNVYRDANAWLFFLLLFPFLSAVKDEKIVNGIFQVLLAGAIWLSIKTVAILFLFSRQYAVYGGLIYKWIRDTGVGEITHISEGSYRIFFQSQIYCLIAFLLICFFILVKNKNNKKFGIVYYGFIYLLGLTIIISQSRSLWLGGLAGFGALLFFGWRYYKISLKKIILACGMLALMIASQIFLVQLITGSLFGNRLSNLPGEPAGASRLNQLKPLTEAIMANPAFGYGFGKTLTYQTRDPRALKANPDGQYTTFAFEWGYLDIALKLGFIGLILYLVLLALIFHQGIVHFKSKTMPTGRQVSNYKQINFGLLSGLIALCVINIFTPYLNHPLGIGYVLLCLAIFNLPTSEKKV